MIRSHIIIITIFLVFTHSLLFAFGLSANLKVPLKVGAIVYSDEFLPGLEGLKAGLKELKYLNEKSVYFDIRVINGDLSRIESLLEEFYSKGIKVLFVTTTPVAIKVMQLNKKYNFKVIFNEVADPVLSNLANSLETPGKNMTGVSHAAFRMIPKRIQMALEFFYDTKKVYYLKGDLSRKLKIVSDKVDETERLLNIKIERINFGDSEYENFLKKLSMQDNSNSIIILGPDAELVINFNKIRDMSYMYGIPLVAMDSSLVERGATFAYASNFYDVGKQSSYILDMIFKGADASLIPIQLPDDVGVYINKTALKYIKNRYDLHFLHYARRCFE
ncbi:MAG: hypothetical protein PWQ25_546 [Deferribacteres bacterium]|nr:hypothetical protein [Deferribacteres bacterium]